MKLGILVVYLASPENSWVIGKHLDRLARTRPFMDYTVYAAVNRLPEELHPMLRGYDFIKPISLPPLEERGSQEHGMYLDMLAAHAVADGCDFICTFDADSWPIRDDWIEITFNLMKNSGCPAAAVLRAENGDSVLPHPLFSFLDASLFLSPYCKYWLDSSVGGEDYTDFLSRNEQRGDTGAGIGFCLMKTGNEWVKILRTNKKNFHYLMGGIYGDLIFHLGASTRDDLVFRGDDVTWIVNALEPIAKIPLFWKYKPSILKLAKRSYVPAAMRRNKAAFDRIAAKINENEAAFYQELCGD